jgi:hypothetical protein
VKCKGGVFGLVVSSRPTLTRCGGTFTSFILGKHEGEPKESISEMGRVTKLLPFPVVFLVGEGYKK